MATYNITSKLTLTGQGVSSDVLNQTNTQTFNVTQPTVESGALDLSTSKTTLGTMDGIKNTGTTYLYLKNTGSATQGTAEIGVDTETQGIAFLAFIGNPANAGTITLISTDLTSKVYTAAAAENLTNNEFKSTGSITQVAESLQKCIQASTGHAGKIVVSSLVGVLTLTQAKGGSTGNSAITVTTTSTVSSAVFTGGGSNVRNKMVVLKPGQFTTIPVAKNVDLSLSSSLTTTCEYGWWTLV